MNRYLLNINDKLLPSMFEVIDNQLMDMFGGLTENLSSLAGKESNIGYPSDVYEVLDSSGKPEKMVIEICAAGIKPELIKVMFDQEDSNKLTVEIEKPENDESGIKKVYFSKRISKKREKRSYLLSDTCDTDNIVAETKEGVLRITIPYKKEVLKIPAKEIKLIAG